MFRASLSCQNARRTPDQLFAGLPEIARTLSGLKLPGELRPRFIGSYDFRGGAGRRRATATVTPVVGNAEKWVLYGEDSCVAVVRVYKPLQEMASEVLVIFGGTHENGTADLLQLAVIEKFSATTMVILADVCGLGEPGGGMATFGIDDGVWEGCVC